MTFSKRMTADSHYDPSRAKILYLCMGSACHQRHGYDLLPRLDALIHRRGLDGQVLLKGAFCLEHCDHGCSLKFEGRVLTGLNEENLAEIFDREILPRCQRD